LNSDQLAKSDILLADGIKDRDSCTQNWSISSEELAPE
jgi:hypothetical protein